MNPLQQYIQQTRRHFLTTSANGLGGLALAHMFREQGLLASETANDPSASASGIDPLLPRKPHFAPRAKNCILIFMEGAPSQLDLFDPKPELNKRHGQPVPESLLKDAEFAFIVPKSVKLMGSPRKFQPHGRSGMIFSDLLPHLATCADDLVMIRSMHTDQFNHHPGQLMLLSGRANFGRPTIGAWLTYGLGSESRNLPGYVVLTAGRGTSGGASLWSSGFLPSSYSGVLLRSKGSPVLNLADPPGVNRPMQRNTLDAVRDLNSLGFQATSDPEIQSRISAYELAFRMQASAPELVDLSGESRATMEAYGVGRTDLNIGQAHRGGGPGQFNQYALNCLLARRLVERGVRFVNIVHASWDHHSNLDKELSFNATMADQPIAALIKDLKQRGLLDETLVVICSEFGRTPLGENRGGNVNNVSGRDHHPAAFTILMAGGGLKGGTVHGATDEIGWFPTENPVHVHDFQATLLHLFGFDHKRLAVRFKGLDVRLTDQAGNVIPEILA